MGFLKDEESILFMDLPTCEGEWPTMTDLKNVKSCGINTTFRIDIHWSEVEPAEGKYHFDDIDWYVDRIQKAGMRCLLEMYNSPAQWCPEDWYVKDSSLYPNRNMLSVWNADAVGAALNFYKLMRDRYNTPDSLVINGYPYQGEDLHFSDYCVMDKCAVLDRAVKGIPTSLQNGDFQNWYYQGYSDFMVAQNKILSENPWHEVWTNLHPFLNPQQRIWNYEVELTNHIPDVHICHLYFTWIQWLNLFGVIKTVRDAVHSDDFGGAEYAEGVHQSVPLAIQEGMRGLLCGPLHPFTGHPHIEPWMVKNLTWAVQTLQEARHKA